jgi:hypothetical protein
MMEFKALNGKTYHAGDTVRLGRGSSPNGDFVYLELGGVNAFLGHGHNLSLDKTYANTGVVIKNIKKGRIRGAEKTWFAVKGGAIGNFSLYIDEAIQSCEVIPCQTNSQSSLSVADELLKLKKLLDAGGDYPSGVQ